MTWKKNWRAAQRKCIAPLAAFLMLVASPAWAQTQGQPTKSATVKATSQPKKPKLVVMIVVDQMRADYVDKFRGQWTGGLKRLLDEGAWFRSAAYPYAATETCPGHSTISTGAFPLNHGMVANAWWDRDAGKMVTCTTDPNAKNVAYAGGSTSGGDSAAQMLLPSYAEELKFQTGGATRVVTFSLKARAAITMAGHKADAATWFDPDTGAWVTSSAYGTLPFLDEFVAKHPMAGDLGQIWTPLLSTSAYLYDEKATGAAIVGSWGPAFPHALLGEAGSRKADKLYFLEWQASPYGDSYLTKLSETAVDSLGLGRSGATDYLGISYSSPDYVGHTFGPRSWEIQDVLARLDKDLGELFALLDQKVGRGNYVVALTADHGVAPIPSDMRKAGFDAGVLNITDLQSRMEKALEPFDLGKPAIAHIAGNEVYFAPGIYARLRHDPAAMKAVLDAALSTPGVSEIFRAEELSSGLKTVSQTRTAAELSFLAARSGDMFVLQQPYWLVGSYTAATTPTGTSHGTPYYYDQRVPLFLMGFGIQPGEYYQPVTPADIAPTLGSLTGVTLAARDGRVLAEALQPHSRK
jgi:predicted AlkP superfamily pyrophosphatase or phosphodiesterase